MKTTPNWMLRTDEEREAERHRRDKAKCDRQLRGTRAARVREATELLVDAARGVVEKWSTGDLAAAVRQLDATVKDYDDANK